MITFLYNYHMKTYRYTIGGKEYEVTVNSVTDGRADVVVNGVSYAVDMGSAGGKSVCAPLPGRIVEMRVASGDVVTEGQVVAVLEAMKMENEIVSESSGVVTQVCVCEGDAVSGGASIVIIK